jgi:hypothetical protein
MSNYSKIVDYAAKDALNTGDPLKLIKGTEIGAEYDAIATAIATKANTASPTFTGVSGFAVGAVGAPSIYMTGYTTTGWYNIGANNWGFAVSGAKVLDVASTGLSVSAVTATFTLSATGASNPLMYLTTTRAFGVNWNWQIGVDQYAEGHWTLTPSTAQGGSTYTTPLIDVSSTGLAVTGTTSTTTGMAVGGATAGTGGIAFPAIAVAVADVNTLDDYEEGTFTPGISFGGGTTGITYSTQAGAYTKIGNRVFCNGKVELSSKGSSTGAAKITGLPFSVGAGNAGLAAVALRMDGVSFADFPQGYGEGTTIVLDEITNAGTKTDLVDTNFGNTSAIIFSFSYYV